MKAFLSLECSILSLRACVAPAPGYLLSAPQSDFYFCRFRTLSAPQHQFPYLWGRPLISSAMTMKQPAQIFPFADSISLAES